jgi:hypothetical protein
VLEISRTTLERWGYLEDATHRRVA